jgi:hypothetical protein
LGHTRAECDALHSRRYPGNVEEWFEGDRYDTLAICRSLALARATFEVAIAEKPGSRFMIRSRTRVVQRIAARLPASDSGGAKFAPPKP